MAKAYSTIGTRNAINDTNNSPPPPKRMDSSKAPKSEYKQVGLGAKVGFADAGGYGHEGHIGKAVDLLNKTVRSQGIMHDCRDGKYNRVLHKGGSENGREQAGVTKKSEY